jgi:hypothetical protein
MKLEGVFKENSYFLLLWRDPNLPKTSRGILLPHQKNIPQGLTDTAPNSCLLDKKACAIN